MSFKNKNRPRREYLGILGASTITALAGCSSEDDDDGSGDGDPTPSGDDNGSDKSDSEDGVAELNRDGEITFNASGGTVTDSFDLPAGLTICEAIFEGDGQHDIELLDTDGNVEDRRIFLSRANETHAEKASLQNERTYVLDISSPAEWSVSLTYPRPDDGKDVPTEMSGTRDRVLGPYSFIGSYELTTESHADGFVQVSIWEPDGEPGFGFETVAQNIGTTDETIFNFDGLGFVEVAGQDWTLEIEES